MTAQRPEQERRVPDDTLPRVSVVIPMFNEERFVGALLDSIAAQDYPRDRMEVLVVDGDSTDGSAAIVRSYEERIPGLRLISNPRRITPSSLNAGIREATGEIYVRIDSHSKVAPTYVRTCVETLLRTGADNVGGLMRAVGTNPWSTAVALATSSPFGVGGARFHYATTPQYVDTVYLGCYRLERLRELGGYDENMVINEDDELNFRLEQQGGRTWLEPAMSTEYHPRSSFRALWRQYYRYGKWKVRLMQKHRRLTSLRHIVPAAWVASVVAGAVLAPWFAWGRGLLALAVGPYAVANLGYSVAIAPRNGWRNLPLLPPVFATLHWAYGAGFLEGIVRFLVLRRER
jgi:cellulose synthase/poly-beta-1,6-N-acetylglucosamine synthase-like glycosyltransferase